MTQALGTLDHQEFLQEYWQKKPLLLRQAIPAFKPELEIDDIAGLACEDGVEARLIRGSYPEQDWQLEYGPFQEQTLRKLPDSRWTLLVQDVEKHYPPLRRLLETFSFLPRWRIDDLMVSVAAPGGSVGPHVDQYDVFLLQVEGRRRWQLAENGDLELQPGTELNVLKSFEAEQEWVLEPGDMLYLPPGVAHHGVALDRCMTWSIGMRAPSTADLLQALGEWLADRHDEGPRYTDPDLQAGGPGAELDSDSVRRFSELAVGMIENKDAFTGFLGAFLSRYRLANEPLGPEQGISRAELLVSLRDGSTLQHNPWTRMVWTNTQTGANLFAAGSTFPCTRETAITVCEPGKLATAGPDFATANAALLCELVNAGHLYLEAQP